MINDFWIVSIFRIWYGFRIVKVFGILIGKGIVNDHWINSMHIWEKFGMKYGYRIVKLLEH